jgi:hypothetical protein
MRRGSGNGEIPGENTCVFRGRAAGGRPRSEKGERAFKKLVKTRTELLSDMRQERIENSFLGKLAGGSSPFPATPASTGA